MLVNFEEHDHVYGQVHIYNNYSKMLHMQGVCSLNNIWLAIVSRNDDTAI